MTAGELNAQVQLERDAISRDATGAEVRTPAVYATRWARFEYLSGAELWRAQQVNATVNARATLRYCTDVLPSDRVIYRGLRFEIKAVVPDELKRAQTVLELRG
jgi:SPP1 family predicted phage head-tail adaptor